MGRRPSSPRSNHDPAEAGIRQHRTLRQQPDHRRHRRPAGARGGSRHARPLGRGGRVHRAAAAHPRRPRRPERPRPAGPGRRCRAGGAGRSGPRGRVSRADGPRRAADDRAPSVRRTRPRAAGRQGPRRRAGRRPAALGGHRAAAPAVAGPAAGRRADHASRPRREARAAGPGGCARHRHPSPPRPRRPLPEQRPAAAQEPGRELGGARVVRGRAHRPGGTGRHHRGPTRSRRRDGHVQRLGAGEGHGFVHRHRRRDPQRVAGLLHHRRPAAVLAGAGRRTDAAGGHSDRRGGGQPRRRPDARGDHGRRWARVAAPAALRVVPDVARGAPVRDRGRRRGRRGMCGGLPHDPRRVHATGRGGGSSCGPRAWTSRSSSSTATSSRPSGRRWTGSRCPRWWRCRARSPGTPNGMAPRSLAGWSPAGSRTWRRRRARPSPRSTCSC